MKINSYWVGLVWSAVMGGLAGLAAGSARRGLAGLIIGALAGHQFAKLIHIEIRRKPDGIAQMRASLGKVMERMRAALRKLMARPKELSSTAASQPLSATQQAAVSTTTRNTLSSEPNPTHAPVDKQLLDLAAFFEGLGKHAEAANYRRMAAQTQAIRSGNTAELERINNTEIKSELS